MRDEAHAECSRRMSRGHTELALSLSLSIGIRYAKPPVGNLRWAAPQPLYSTSTATNRLQNLKKGPICPQSGDTSNQSEDCLFINIQRPRRSIGQPKLPVLLFSHGGGFQSGSSLSLDPSEFIKVAQSNNQDVIVATINYRLGALGEIQ